MAQAFKAKVTDTTLLSWELCSVSSSQKTRRDAPRCTPPGFYVFNERTSNLYSADTAEGVSDASGELDAGAAKL